MAPRILPDQAYLRQLMDYDPATGALTWLERPREHFASTGAWKCWQRRYAGKVAGSRRKDGYLHLQIDGRLYLAHRVIFKLMTGTDPAVEIDHDNKERSDNHWDNLRPATRPQNMWNARMKRNNRALLKGVTARPDRQGFVASIRLDGKLRYLGSFPTAEAAHAAYCTAAQEHFGAFWTPG